MLLKVMYFIISTISSQIQRETVINYYLAIFLTNKQNIVKILDVYEKELLQVRRRTNV